MIHEDVWIFYKLFAICYIKYHKEGARPPFAYNKIIQLPMTRKSHYFGVLPVFIIALSVTAPADADLVSRLGGRAINDTDSNITWLAHANLTVINKLGLTEPLGVHPNDSSGVEGLSLIHI